MHNYYDRDAPLPADRASYKYLYNDYFHDSIITGLCVNSARRELELSLQCSRECEEEQGNRDNILEEKYGYRLYFSGLHHFGGSSALQWTEYLNGRFKAIRGAKGNFYFRIQTADGYMDIGYDRFRIRKVRGRVSYRGIDEISPWIDKACAARPEEAAAIRKLMDEYGLSQEQVAGSIGRSRSAVANALRLLDLPEDAVKLVTDGTLSAGHARTLLGLLDKGQIGDVARKCVQSALSVRELESLVKKLNRLYTQQRDAIEDDAGAGEVVVDYFASLENRFTSATGRRVKITETRNKKVLQLEYRDNEDLEELLRSLAGDAFLDEV